MELVKQREKKRDRTSNRVSVEEISMGIPDAPILEEFECLLEVEQVTNSYPQDDEVDYIERELRSAAIDCGMEEQVQEIDDVIGNQRDLNASTTSNRTKESEDVEKTERITDGPSQMNDIAQNTESLKEPQCDNQLNTSEQAKSIFKEESCSIEQDHPADSRLKENHLMNSGSLTSTDSCTPGSLDKKSQQEDSTAKGDHVRRSKEIESNSTSLYSRAATLLSKMQDGERSVDFTDGLVSPDSVKPFTERQLASLYPNEELSLLDSFVNEFLSSHIQRSDHRHRLKELLSDYLRAKNHLNSNSNDLERLKRLFADFRQKVWCLKKKCVTESGECQDGNPVVANHEFLTAMFDSQAYQSLQRTLGAIKDSFHESRSIYCYESEIYKLCIEYYIQSLIAVCKNLMDDIKENDIARDSNVGNNVSIDLSIKSVSLIPESNKKERTSATTMMRMELRTCIAILFDFQRLGSVKDGRFITDTRDWLTRLVAILLRLATWQDHLFLLNHILRCPGGVTSWARSYIQAPMPVDHNLTTSRLNDPYLDHAVTVLATVLIPIKDRDKFLEQVQKSFMEPCSDMEHGDTVWLMLDEEGEEDEDIANLGFNLFESDVISLLNQIPFTSIFERALCIIRDQQNERFHQDKASLTSQHLLRMFAFFTALVRILNQGLRTYDSPRYRQLTKKLSALIRDVLQYANDQWEAFDNSQIKDQSILTKLQLEFDCFFFRSVTCIYSSRRLGAWQYLASIPYHMISSKVLWEIYYVLHVDFCRNQYMNVDNSDKQVNDWMEELNSKDLRAKFEERLSQMPGDESCYLLTTFANMAVARDSRDRNFIHTVTLDLFQTGFLSEKTRDCCSKDARPLLSNLINEHPSLLSVIVRKLGENFGSIETLSLYLFNALRLDGWVPEEEDMLILYNWLDKYPLNSNESHLARVIIGQLNWGLNESGDLYLPIDLHRQVALLIVEVHMKHVEDPGGQNASGMLVEGVKQVSSMIRWQNAEHQFISWAWDVISKLKLHRLDQSDAVTRSTLMDPGSSLSGIPDMDVDPKLEILAKGVREKKPLASYVAILMTMWGHSVPLICSSGFQQLEVLLANYKYEQALSCFYLVVPLFVECVDSSLIKNEKFLGIVSALLTADSNRASYMKAAKNLLSPEEFPGPLLKMFGNMIQSHLYSYKNYNLESPRDLVYLWLSTFMLIPDWNKDHSVMHLMDVVISSSFFYADAKIIVDRMFQNLFTNATNRNKMASFGSFFNWATGSSSSNSLLGKSTQSVWVAYEVLLTEQYNREIKSGLWREILKELAGKTRVSLDTAVKRACATIKMQSFSSNGLSIYRWSQQALDTPMDHPILPLLWQNFFALFLARVPSASGVVDHGGVGEKFFEGMINLSYLKRLKKRLNDTTSYFQSKSEQDLENTAGHSERGQEETASHYQLSADQNSEPELNLENSSDQDGEERSVFGNRSKFYLQLARFYKTLSLWLEEPRLQEPGLYFPALPPQYMSQKLVELVHDNWTPWLEYVDYYQVQLMQLAAVKSWEKSSFRQEGQRNLPNRANSFMAPDSLDPLRRICKRLLQYEDPIPAPPVTKNPEQFKNLISPACYVLYDADSLIEKVKKEVKILTDYARTYFVMMSEYAAKDSDFLELVPKLYKVVENCVTLHALCDPVETNRRQIRVGERPVAVNCAGPAVITMKVPEAFINDSVDLMIAQNRAEYENLLIKSSQPPPSKVTQASVFMDHLVATLVHEITTIRNYVNASTNSLEKLQQTGIRLFYYLIECYTEEVAYCPPTRQLITTCMERLGQSFVNGEENEGPRLLNTIIDKPNLGSLLAPYFTPVAGSAVRFLQMYQTIVKYSAGTNMDLCFVLLSKFDVAVWLNHKRPRLSDRSRFIDLVAEALCEMGYNPDKTKLVLHELFRNHLRLVLSHDFPEHYGEILSTLLRSSEGQNLSLDVWRDFLTTLTGRTRNNAFATFNCLKIRDEIRYYATEQRLLSHQEIRETAVLLNRHFAQERLQYGLYGLYPKYRIYNEPLSVFLGMVGHAFVALTLQLDRGSLGDQLCDKIWPILNDMYSPWLAPYWTCNLKEPTAAWIQQLTDDRSVLLPWIISDGPYANKMIAMFVDCIRFILDTLPASNKILSSLWQSYVTDYAHPSVKEHILNVIHGNFLTLPWDRFNPNLNDLELMVKILDQFLPDSHLFLGTVFISIDWKRWMSDWVTGSPSVSSLTRIHVCLINLMVKLANEANIRENDKAIQLITAAEKFSWHLLDAVAYDHIINWYVTNCDPRHILQSSTGQCYPMDTAVNRLLKMAAGYDSSLNHFHPSTLKKRQLYIRSTVKLLNNCAVRHKNLLLEVPRAFSETLSAILDDMEAVITNTVAESQQVAEACVLITEIMAAVNQHGSGHVEQLRLGWCSWLSKRSAGNPILVAVLKTIATVTEVPSVYGELMESALEAYFKFNVLEEVPPSWAEALRIIQSGVPAPKQPVMLPLETVLVNEGKLLALYSILLKRLPSCQDIREEGMLLSNLMDWIAAIRPANVDEEKLPLLWSKACELAHRQCLYNDTTKIAARALKSLSKSLIAFVDEGGQGGWAILDAIGLRKSSHLSPRCKFLCRATAVYCLAQLPECKSSVDQLVRYTAYSPGVAPASNCETDSETEIRPSLEAVKAMQALEGLLLNKQFAEVKCDVERAIRLIKDPGNSLHNATAVIGTMATEIYNQRYLHVLID